jgi:diaminopimelate decarboxylase
MTLYTVGSFKSITGYKNYISIDGGMADNPRYALYQSPYTVVVANRAERKGRLSPRFGPLLRERRSDSGGCCDTALAKKAIFSPFL